MDPVKKKWLDAIGTPNAPIPAAPLQLLSTHAFPSFHTELYLQVNGDGTAQRVLFAIPNRIDRPCPAVAVPFYYPEAMLGETLPGGKNHHYYKETYIMRHLVMRGYITASADAYHLTYLKSEKSDVDFSRWSDAAQALLRENPAWSGIGKLVSDTRLLIDALAADPRVDAERIGIAGHSLGGKMAFYTGCLDERIRVILASDFGFGWEQSNWHDCWYWGDKLEELKQAGMDHTELLGLSHGKPFCLLAGEYDDASSGERMRRAKGYAPNDERLCFVHHATGHTPPLCALETGYAFIDNWLKK